MNERKVIELSDGSNLHIIPTDEGVVFDRYDKDNNEVLESGYMFVVDILELIQ